jgi:hypothetical protein
MLNDESDDTRYSLQSDWMLVKYTSGSIPALFSIGLGVADVRQVQLIDDLLVACGCVLVGPVVVRLGRCAAVALFGKGVSVVLLALSL